MSMEKALDRQKRALGETQEEPWEGRGGPWLEEAGAEPPRAFLGACQATSQPPEWRENSANQCVVTCDCSPKKLTYLVSRDFPRVLHFCPLEKREAKLSPSSFMSDAECALSSREPQCRGNTT